MKKKNEKSIIGIIPARYGSTRFPGKPLVSIQGKTLIQRTYENAMRCPLIDELIIATDDQRIFDHAADFGARVMMTPANCPTGSDRLAHVLQQDESLQKAEIILNVQGDEPGVDPSTTIAIIEALRKDPTAVMSTGVYPMTCSTNIENSNHVKCVLDLFGNVLYFSRMPIPGFHSSNRQRELTYYKHIGIYAYRPQFLLQYVKLPMTPLQCAEDLEQLKVLEHGFKIKAAVVENMSADVNTPEDIKIVEQELCKQNTFSSLAESVHP